MFYKKIFLYMSEALGALGSSAIAGASGLLDTGLSYALGSKSSKKQYERQLDMLAMQNYINDYNYNKYESPSAKMRQYKEAGLNPNLVYGSATGGSVGSVGLPQVDSVSHNFSPFSQGMKNFLNSQNFKLEKQLKDLEIARAKQEQEDLPQKKERETQLFNKKMEKEEAMINKINKEAENIGKNKGGSNAIKEVNAWDVSLGRYGIPAKVGREKNGKYYAQVFGYKQYKEPKARDNFGNVYDKSGKLVNFRGSNL